MKIDIKKLDYTSILLITMKEARDKGDGISISSKLVADVLDELGIEWRWK